MSAFLQKRTLASGLKRPVLDAQSICSIFHNRGQHFGDILAVETGRKHQYRKRQRERYTCVFTFPLPKLLNWIEHLSCKRPELYSEYWDQSALNRPLKAG